MVDLGDVGFICWRGLLGIDGREGIGAAGARLIGSRGRAEWTRKNHVAVAVAVAPSTERMLVLGRGLWCVVVVEGGIRDEGRRLGGRREGDEDDEEKRLRPRPRGRPRAAQRKEAE